MPLSLPIINIQDVAERHLCCGCGACASLDPARIRMVDDLSVGRRPLVSSEALGDQRASDAMRACPGAALIRSESDLPEDADPCMTAAWGPVLEVWEGYATDPEIRRAGSSGGAATALALFGIEKGGMRGAIHIAARMDRPYLNETVLSTTRADLLGRTGSRYAPASPCDSLHLITEQEGPSVFIGKPCDAAAVQAARRLRPDLNAKLGLVVAFFCAGAPSTQGTLELLKSVGVNDPDSITSLRYRGNGWPGTWTVTWRDADGVERSAQRTYEDSWGFLQRYRQWRCYICPDHSGEFADIAVGDPWYRPVVAGEPGRSLIVVRTERGRRVLHAATAAGYLVLERQDALLLPKSQPNLIGARGALWGRLMALRLLGAPVPQYRGFPTFRFWLGALGLVEKLRSLTGTARRVKRKRLRDRIPVKELQQGAIR